MNKKLKYSLWSLLFIALMYFFATININHFSYKNHFITILKKEIGSGVNSHHEVFIFPRFKLTSAFIDRYDYIKLAEYSKIMIAIKEDSLKIYTEPNKITVNNNGKLFEIKENSIYHLKKFSGFENVTVYHAQSLNNFNLLYKGDNIKKQYIKDTEEYWKKSY